MVSRSRDWRVLWSVLRVPSGSSGPPLADPGPLGGCRRATHSSRVHSHRGLGRRADCPVLPALRDTVCRQREHWARVRPHRAPCLYVLCSQSPRSSRGHVVLSALAFSWGLKPSFLLPHWPTSRRGRGSNVRYFLSLSLLAPSLGSQSISTSSPGV